MSTEHVHVEVLAAGPQKHISEPHRFFIVVLGAYGCMCCSFTYAFNLISGAMQQRYNLSQRDLSSITTVGLVIQYIMLPYAFLYDFIGPIPICTIMTIYFVIGSVLLALCFNGRVHGNTVRLCVFNAFLMGACGLFDLESCVTIPSHFPTRKGAATAMLKTLTGLGQAIVGSIYTAFFTEHTDSYFFFLMAFATVVGLISIAFMRLPPYHLTNYELTHLSEEKKRIRKAKKAQYLRQNPPVACFIYGFIIKTILIVFLPVESTVVTYLDLKSNYKIAFATVIIVFTLAFIGVVFPIALTTELLKKSCRSSTSKEFSRSNNHDAPPITVDTSVNNDNGNELTNAADSMEVGNNKNLTDLHNNNEPIGNRNNGNENNNKLPETVVDYIAPQYQGRFLNDLLTPEL